MEIELKFQLSEASHKALEAVLRSEGAQSQTLIAKYFDTPERDLARAGMSLRLRKESRVWFQTLKSPSGAASAAREEHEVRLGVMPEPKIDLSHYLGTDTGNKLERLLQHSESGKLACRYTTDIRRVHIRAGLRTCVEYALDSGKISAKPRGRRTPIELSVSEIELELVSGPVSGLFTFARKILREYEAWIDVRSKAQRGDTLAGGKLITSPAKAGSLRVENSSLKALIVAALRDCTRQVLQNASQIASSEGGGAEHIHQLRVGLRRLRSAISLFGKFGGDKLINWEPHAKSLTSSLGSNRDIDMMAESIWPHLREANAPLVELPMADTLRSPANLIRDPKVQQWLLDLIAFEFRLSDDVVDGDWTLLIPVISGWYRQCRTGATQFHSLDVAKRHRLRKRLKQLRYAIQFIEPELPPKQYRRYAKVLTSALDDLGQYNDLQVALKNYLEFAETDHRAWFAVGWIKAQITEAELRCEKSLLIFYDAHPPWVAHI